MRVHVELSGLEHGWIELSICAGDQSFAGSMSYTPYDSLSELVTAVSLMLKGGDTAVVRWSGEPTQYEMHFTRCGEHIELRVLEWPDHRRRQRGEVVRLLTSGSFDDICRPFWKTLRDLQSRFTDQELATRWHREFPGRAVASLTEQIRSRD